MNTYRPVLDDELMAQLAEQQVPVLPEASVAARLKARVLDQVRQTTTEPERRSRTESQVAPLRAITLSASSGEWVALGEKVEIKLLRTSAESRSFLLRLHPGAVLPAHDHPLEEECYVLEGEVRFGDIQVRAGDYHLAPQGVPHGVMRSRTGALLFLRGANPAT